MVYYYYTLVSRQLVFCLSVRLVVMYVHLSVPLFVGGGRVVRWCWVNFQCRGVLLVWIRVGQGPTVLAVGAGGGCLDIFALVCHLFSFSFSLGDGPI